MVSTFSISDVDPWENEYAIIYLDHDPGLSARYTIDRDVKRLIPIAIQHLSNAWHKLGDGYTMVDWVMPEKHKEPTPPGQLDWMRAEVLHQRVLPPRAMAHEASEWVRGLGGNYWWTWRWVMGLLSVHRALYGAEHPMAYMAFTLEVMPPVLLETASQQTEPPVQMQQEYKVETPDGLYIECVDSWRNYYAKRRQRLLRWSGRTAPPWLVQTESGWKLSRV